jgi:hypothetical protein
VLFGIEKDAMKMKGMTLLEVLFAVSSLMAQSGTGQSSGANKRHSKYPNGEVTV